MNIFTLPSDDIYEICFQNSSVCILQCIFKNIFQIRNGLLMVGKLQEPNLWPRTFCSLGIFFKSCLSALSSYTLYLCILSFYTISLNLKLHGCGIWYPSVHSSLLGMKMARFASGMPPARLCHFCINCPLLVSLMLTYTAITIVVKWRRSGRRSERYTEEW